VRHAPRRPHRHRPGEELPVHPQPGRSRRLPEPAGRHHPSNGRLANVSDPNNARFYPDQSLQPIIVYYPTTGEHAIQVSVGVGNGGVPDQVLLTARKGRRTLTDLFAG
jgi:hypothetical protein